MKDAHYWRTQYNRAAATHASIAKERNRLFAELDKMRCKVENLERSCKTHAAVAGKLDKDRALLIEQVQGRNIEIDKLRAIGQDLSGQRDVLRGKAEYYVDQCDRWANQWNIMAKQHVATVKDLKGKLECARLARDAALRVRSEAVTELDEVADKVEGMAADLVDINDMIEDRIIEEGQKWEAKLYRMKQSRDALWGGVRDALAMLGRRDLQHGPAREVATNRLKEAKRDGFLAEATKFSTELEKLKNALFEQRAYSDEWRDKYRAKTVDFNRLRLEHVQLKEIVEDGRCENYPGQTVDYLWGKWFTERPVPEALSADHLFACVMSDYERRLRNVDDGVARASRDQRIEDCKLVCDVCSEGSGHAFVGEAHPSVKRDGTWVHNVRLRSGDVAVIKCGASAIREAHKEAD